MEFVPATCPWCFEPGEVAVEPDLVGQLIVDCEVCCRPWDIVVRWENGSPFVTVERGN
ncbi:MAG: hypothetical protein ACJA1R_000136 [Flavobacteriales bacterium]|jgi:hypothetical protein